MQTFQPNLFIPATLIGTVDFYHFTALSLTLSFAGVYKLCANQNLLASLCHTLFNWSGCNVIMVSEQFHLNVLTLILSEI